LRVNLLTAFRLGKSAMLSRLIVMNSVAIGILAAVSWALVDASTPASATAASPREGNRLALETSPYLLQHAENPVDWHPWGEAAFARARAEDKPIFLSVGYSTCYWCHVMEREVFADPEIATLLNETVISIKVDREERPDIDEIYLAAVQLMTGAGGWPMSVLLTPDLKPFFGGTYMPRDQFRQLIQDLGEDWENSRSELLAMAEQVTTALEGYADQSGSAADNPLPPATALRKAAAQYARSFDTRNGGFGTAPKFPRPAQLEALLSDYELNDNQRSLDMVSQTLDAMARGGIHDQIGGGFHRYSTDARWRMPHFEKMLYDNAQLLHVYARAYHLTGTADFKRVAEGIAAYVRQEMTASSGLFRSAQDSEAGREEGRSYTWTREEIRALLDDDAFALAETVYGLDNPPDFDGRHILHWPRGYAETAGILGLKPEAMFARLAPVRTALLDARHKRQQPGIDDKAITAWNGLMIEALAYAAAVLDRPEYSHAAAQAASALLTIHRGSDGGLLHVSRHGRAKLGAYLEDYAALILGLQALYESTGELRWHRAASRLADQMIATLWDDARGGFHRAADDVPHLLVQARQSYDGALPAGNSLAARALTRLSTGAPDRERNRYAPYAAGSFRAFAPILRQQPRDLPYMLMALSDYHQSDLHTDPALPATRPRLQTTADLVSFAVHRESGTAFRVQLTIESGWHVNATPASLDFLIPTRVEARLDGRELTLQADYPEGQVIDSPLGDWRVYSKVVAIPVRLRNDAPADGGQMEFTVRAQACNDSGVCLAPATLRQAGPTQPDAE
jgi:uncharacterized protein YyaL (SSP411 family)